MPSLLDISISARYGKQTVLSGVRMAIEPGDIVGLVGQSGSGKSTLGLAILGLLERPDGAAIRDLTAATGWQVHSVRAALTGLRKDGKELIRAKDEAGVTRYRLAAAG